jgi:cytochrome P450
VVTASPGEGPFAAWVFDRTRWSATLQRVSRHAQEVLQLSPGERWSGEVKLPKFAYFPFGGGSRSCVGEPFAWMEGVLLLATISRSWSMHHARGHKVEMLPRITLRPKYGMKMELRKR